jgi:small conductance mechanosensitive channel
MDVILSYFDLLLPDVSPLVFAKGAFGIAMTLLAGLLAQQLLRFVSNILRRHLTKSGDGARKERLVRANSLTTVLSASLSIMIWLIVLLVVLEQVGIDVGPFLASAGILGLAVSFGAQDLVKDVIAGLFFLIENQFNAGDVVDINGKKGKVVNMSLRTITLEDVDDGTHYMIRNSQVGILARFRPEVAVELKESKDKAKK